ncbi:hypothetical protein CBD41_01545 [bacterium TMED181]|nr:hypothetical protein [Planctomycetota bacterium]OUW47067.1 MAG: hypothetical protein CBD41_01545 [bacterium TMED181]
MSQWKLVRSSDWNLAIPKSDPKGRWLHLILDADSPGNILSTSVLEDLKQTLSRVVEHDGIQAVIVSSAKDGYFCSGADLDIIESAKDPDEVYRQCREIQDLFGLLGGFQVPSFCVIQGVCLGGGLELALGCSSRIVVNSPETRIGLPEVNLGILPGFGGTVRMSRLLGLRNALTWILTGGRMPAKAAWKKGVADYMIPPEGFRQTALKIIDKESKSQLKNCHSRRKKLRSGMMAKLVDGTPFGRSFVAKEALKGIRKKTGGKLPAPERALEVALFASSGSLVPALEKEAREISKLVTGEISKNLVHIFKNSERARRGDPSEPSGSWGSSDSLVVLGAGTMGSGIVSVALQKGLAVRLRDISREGLERGLRFVGQQIQQRFRKKRMSRETRDETLARLTYGKDLEGLASAGCVLEAVVERLDVKRSVLADLSDRLPENCIFATNTSALSVTRIQEDSPIAERVVGLHFFNPVPMMPLVEVIPGEWTSPETVGKALALARKLGKYPVVAKDSPGFVVNRILVPYLLGASRLLLTGIPGHEIDKVARRHGLPMGPFKLMDEVGLDVGLEVQRTLEAAFGSRYQASSLLNDMVEKGWLGKKSGTGFYRHQGGGVTWNSDLEIPPHLAITGMSKKSPDQIIHALIDPMVDEASRCLVEGVVSDAGILDLAMIMGTGFPPHLGGLLKDADQQGLNTIVDRLEKSHASGDPRTPCEGLIQKAENGQFFHDVV